MMKRIGELKAELDRIKLKSECQAECIDAFDKKLREAEAENARLRALDSLKTISLTDSPTWQTIGAYAEVKEENARLKAEVERLTADLNKMTKTPDGVHYVEVDVSFWTKSGSRLPSSYSTFWSNDKGVQS